MRESDLAVFKKAAGLIGLANRAGKVVSGEDSSLMLIRRGGAAIALLDEEIGPNTGKRITDACRHHNVKLARLPQGMLGNAIGKQNRMVATLHRGSLADALSVELKGSVVEIVTAE